MEAPATSDRTLKQEFAHALSLYSLLLPNNTDTSVAIRTNPPASTTISQRDLQSTSSEGYQSLLLQCISSFEASKSKAERLSLFSDNESIEDVATNSILFLTIDYYLATLNDRIYTAGISERKPLAIKSKELYLSFLTLCDSYGLLKPESAKILHVIQKAPVESPIFTKAFAQSYKDPAEQRAARIAKFKREKAIENSVKELRDRMLANTEADDDDDDDIARDLYLRQIELFAERSFNSLQGLDSELEILAMAPSQPAPPLQPPKSESEKKKDDYSDRLDAPSRSSQPLLTPQGKVNRPFMIVNKREQLKNNVFKPDYVLPTMTIDEYLEEERKMGNIIEGGGPESAKKTEVDEDNDEEQDKETYRLRQWDEFTEANPRGSGNTKMNRG